MESARRDVYITLLSGLWEGSGKSSHLFRIIYSYSLHFTENENETFIWHISYNHESFTSNGPCKRSSCNPTQTLSLSYFLLDHLPQSNKLRIYVRLPLLPGNLKHHWKHKNIDLLGMNYAISSFPPSQSFVSRLFGSVDFNISFRNLMLGLLYHVF